jgi:hypothetical protein
MFMRLGRRDDEGKEKVALPKNEARLYAPGISGNEIVNPKWQPA